MFVPFEELMDFEFDVCCCEGTFKSEEPPLRGLEVTMKDEDRGGYLDIDGFGLSFDDPEARERELVDCCENSDDR